MTEDTLDQIVSQARDHAHENFSAVFDNLTSRLQQHFESALETRVQAAREQGVGRIRRQFSNQLTQALRRLRQFEDEARWSSALLEAAGTLCDRAALFIVREGLHLQAVRGMILPPDFRDVPLADAPAFANVQQARDTVVALRTMGELSPQIAGVVGEQSEGRCWLFPVKTRDRLAAVLYADTEGHIEIEALELVTAMAGLALDAVRSQPQLVSIALPASPAAEQSPEDLRARRTALVREARRRLQLDGFDNAME